MLTLILLSAFGLDFNVCEKPLRFAVIRESCYSLTCSCVDCSGAACKCGTATVPKAIPVFNLNTGKSRVMKYDDSAVRVCGPNGCSVQYVPNHNVGNSHIYVPTNYPTFSDSSNSSNFSNSCPGGNCGTRRGLFGRRR